LKEKIAELLVFYGEQADELSKKIEELGLERDAIVIGGVCVFNDEEDTVSQGSNFFVEDEDELEFALALLKLNYEKRNSDYSNFIDMINNNDDEIN
jgi:methylmalonyl-CoA mutase cobalamin-binding subunit